MIVVDASVALQWVTEEDASMLADTALLLDDLIAPDLLLLEAGNALRRKVSLGEMTMAQASSDLKFIGGKIAVQRSSRTLVHRAMEIAQQMGHPIYDCVYVALADRRDCPLVTNDAELVRRMKRAGFGGMVRDLPIHPGAGS